MPCHVCKRVPTMQRMARPKGYKLSRAAWDDLVRGAKRLTVSDVADATGIQSATISNLIGGKAGASLTMARKLCAGLDVDVETLFPALNPRIVQDVLDHMEVAA